MMKNIKAFIEDLATEKVTPNVYNQYSYASSENTVRRDNLLNYLKHMSRLKPKILLVGEAPGYRGCRLTGVPFTSEHLLMNNIEGLNLFGKENGYQLATNGDKLLKESTSTIIWKTMVDFNFMALSWNAFPFHPHKQGNKNSNRAPFKKELRIGEKYLRHLIEMYQIDRIIAVGNKAEESLHKMGFSCEKVRHPAQGGKNKFVEGIRFITEQEQAFE